MPSLGLSPTSRVNHRDGAGCARGRSCHKAGPPRRRLWSACGRRRAEPVSARGTGGLSWTYLTFFPLLTDLSTHSGDQAGKSFAAAGSAQLNRSQDPGGGAHVVIARMVIAIATAIPKINASLSGFRSMSSRLAPYRCCGGEARGGDGERSVSPITFRSYRQTL